MPFVSIPKYLLRQANTNAAFHEESKFALSQNELLWLSFPFSFLGSGSFGDCADTRRKRKMLEEEGVRFSNGKVRRRCSTK